MKKQLCAMVLSLTLGCQLILVPATFANLADDTLNSLKSDPSYQETVDKLTDTNQVTESDVDNYVRDVINRLDGEITNESIKDAASDSIYSNPNMLDAVLSGFSNEDIKRARNGQLPESLETLGRLFQQELLGKQITPGGTGGGGLSGEEYKIVISAIKAEVDAKGKQSINLTGSQLQEVIGAKKALEMNFGDLKVSFSHEALNISSLNDKEEAQLQVGAKEITSNDSSNLLTTAKNGGLFKMAGNTFEFTASILDGDNIEQLNAFNGKVVITLPVPLGYRESAATGYLKVYHYNEKEGSWDLVGGTYDTDKDVIAFETSHFSKYALLQKAEANGVVSKFSDLKGHWAENDIELMASKGYVNGVGEGVFSPQAQVTRAEFAAMLVNVLGLKESGVISFNDVTANSWYYTSVARAFKAGLTKGKEEDTFAPQDPISRQEMAAMICNAMTYKGIPSAGDLSVLKTFKDSSSISEWAKLSTARAFEAKIVKGKPTGGGLAFGPQDYATRAEAMVMLRNLINLWKN